jgi:hypothetical protein
MKDWVLRLEIEDWFCETYLQSIGMSFAGHFHHLGIASLVPIFSLNSLYCDIWFPGLLAPRKTSQLYDQSSSGCLYTSDYFSHKSSYVSFTCYEMKKYSIYGMVWCYHFMAWQMIMYGTAGLDFGPMGNRFLIFCNHSLHQIWGWI